MSLLPKPSTSTDALVLRTWSCGETSAIASLLTRDHGYVKVIAKAARRPQSRLRALVEPGRLVNAEFGIDPARELQYLRGGSVELDPLGPGTTLERTAFLLGALELVDRCRPQGWSQPSDRGNPPTVELFAVCADFVRVLSSGSCFDPALVFFALEWELLERHGLAPVVAGCVGCGRENSDAAGANLLFSAAEGGVLCQSCAGRSEVNGGKLLSSSALAILLRLVDSGVRVNWEEPLARPLRREIGALLHGFLGYHLPGYRLPAALDLLRPRKD